MYGNKFEFYGAPNIDLELRCLEELRGSYPSSMYPSKPTGKGMVFDLNKKKKTDPRIGVGEFYHLKTPFGMEFFFYQTGTLKNGNASGYQVDIDAKTGFKPGYPKKKDISRIDFGGSTPIWKRINKKKVPPDVMLKFRNVMEDVSLNPWDRFFEALES